MDETPDPFYEEKLSTDDLAVLRNFDAMDFVVGEQPAELPQNTREKLSLSSVLHDDMPEELTSDDLLLLFISEIESDLTILSEGIQQLAPGKPVDSRRIHFLERKAHKIKGSAATFGCTVFPVIARYAEKLLFSMKQEAFYSSLHIELVLQAAVALESTLSSLVTTGEESSALLEEFEASLKEHDLAIVADLPASGLSSPRSVAEKEAIAEGNARRAETGSLAAKPLPDLAAAPPSVRIETARYEQLLLHTGELADLQLPVSRAQEQVELAIEELHAAQVRLTKLESRYSMFPLTAPVAESAAGRWEGILIRPASSLIASILDEAEERLGHEYEPKEHRGLRQNKEQRESHRGQQTVTGEPLYWDELEIDRYTETDTLQNVLSEAIADVAAASAQLQTAFAQLQVALQKQITAVQHVRRDALSLRVTPLSVLVGRIERMIVMNDDAQQAQLDYQAFPATSRPRLTPLSRDTRDTKSGSIRFEVRGETTEIDQEVLEALKNPLLRLARACVTPGLQLEETSGRHEITVWFRAADLGNEVTIELGSSIEIESGAVDEVQDALRRLHGSITVLRNTAGGMSFHLRLPRSHSALRGLLVQVSSQHVVVPFAQIQRIDYGHVEDPGVYSLGKLLGLPPEPHPQSYPVLVLYPERASLRVQVDGILGDVEQIVKPLAPYMQRAGITGTMIGDEGNVLLVLNLAELIHRSTQSHATRQEKQSAATSSLAVPGQKVVLVADDSVSIRGSLHQTLASAGYLVVGVDDGMEALEYLLNHIDCLPAVLLLDIEMPYLNGYDLLSIMGANAHLASVKTIMLSSRNSEKHRRRALELGAVEYLTKPCPHDLLLSTIQSLLA